MSLHTSKNIIQEWWENAKSHNLQGPAVNGENSSFWIEYAEEKNLLSKK